jgi:hypothetical protein
VWGCFNFYLTQHLYFLCFFLKHNFFFGGGGGGGRAGHERTHIKVKTKHSFTVILASVTFVICGYQKVQRAEETYSKANS